MSIATEKLLPSSKRFQLIKITPARYVNDDLSLVSGNYEMAFPFANIEKVERNGTALSLETTVASNDDYSWDGTTLTIKLAAAPDVDDNVIIVFYSLYYTGSKYRYAPKDPESAESASNPMVEWQPLVAKYPTISQTIRNIRAGILTIADTSLRLINADHTFEQYLTAEDSFSNKDVTIWQCITSTANIQKLYKGQVKGIRMTDGSVNIGIFDPFTKLQQNAYMGDTGNEAYFLRLTDSFPSLAPAYHDQPCPYLMATSKYETDFEGLGDATGVAWWNTFTGGTVAACTDFANNGLTSNSTNREYGLCRVGSSGLKLLDFGTVVRYSTDVTISPKSRYYYLTDHNLVPGDQFKDGTDYFLVSYVGDMRTYPDVAGLTYNVRITKVVGTGAPSVTPTATYGTPETAPTVWYDDGGTYQLLYWGVHFTWSKAALDSGNQYIKVTLNSGASSPETLTSITEIDPNQQNIYFIVSPEDELTHGTAVQRLCEDSGMTVNAASITAADSALAANVVMSVPNYNESDYSSARKYLEMILKSTMGYLKINSDLEASYHLLAAPRSGDAVDNTDFLTRSMSVKIDYSDIASEVIATNKNLPGILNIDASETASASQSTNKAKYLHGIDKTYKFYHVLNRIDNRIAAIAAIQAERQATYSLATATEQIDAEIGDDITLEADNILGSASTYNLKITSIKKDGKKVTITADDIEGL